MKQWMTLALLGTVVGCDAQAGGKYSGEPLLTMTGSVELALEVENADQLMPALAFRASDETMHLVDADVEGRFPAEFTLNVYEPPPEAAIQALEAHYEQRPRVAIGYVAAVTPETPRTFRYATVQQSMGVCSADTGRCDSVESWCTSDESACYTETTTCPEIDSPAEDCTTVAEGDPALKMDRWDQFAGLSENYMVLWLEEPAPPQSWIAYAIGQRDEGLAQGYHLIHLVQQEEPAGYSACMVEASELAAERVNQRFETSYSAVEIEDRCAFEGFCEQDELFAAFKRAEVVAEVELNCGPDDTLITRIADPANERISVRIGQDVEPF